MGNKLKIRCPVCKKKTFWEGNPYRPFCSKECKLADLKYFEGTIDELIETSKNPEYKEFFIKIKNSIVENGMPPEKIKFKFKRGFLGPAGEIIRTVKKGNYTTIVIGRRGRGKVKEFLLGSVSQKIISYFEDRAIWVIN